VWSPSKGEKALKSFPRECRAQVWSPSKGDRSSEDIPKGCRARFNHISNSREPSKSFLKEPTKSAIMNSTYFEDISYEEYHLCNVWKRKMFFAFASKNKEDFSFTHHKRQKKKSKNQNENVLHYRQMLKSFECLCSLHRKYYNKKVLPNVYYPC
jgi:hypothetical protein